MYSIWCHSREAVAVLLDPHRPNWVPTMTIQTQWPPFTNRSPTTNTQKQPRLIIYKCSVGWKHENKYRAHENHALRPPTLYVHPGESDGVWASFLMATLSSSWASLLALRDSLRRAWSTASNFILSFLISTSSLTPFPPLTLLSSSGEASFPCEASSPEEAKVMRIQIQEYKLNLNKECKGGDKGYM